MQEKKCRITKTHILLLAHGITMGGKSSADRIHPLLLVSTGSEGSGVHRVEEHGGHPLLSVSLLLSAVVRKELGDLCKEEGPQDRARVRKDRHTRKSVAGRKK